MPRGFGDARGSFRVEITWMEQRGMMICHPGVRTQSLVSKWLDLARNGAGGCQNASVSMLGSLGAHRSRFRSK